MDRTYAFLGLLKGERLSSIQVGEDAVLILKVTVLAGSSGSRVGLHRGSRGLGRRIRHGCVAGTVS
jgi:hypothetical protein